MIHAGLPGADRAPLWRWDPAKDPGLSAGSAASFHNIDECKPVDGGRTILVCASGGGVAAVDVAAGCARWCAYLPKPWAGPHSVERLPDGRVAVANSTGVDALQLIDLNDAPLDPAKQTVVTALPVPGAHGVVWDADRNSLFVLGYTNLLELAYRPEPMSVTVKRRWNYVAACGDAWGHDLVADGRGGYYLTNHTAVWRFDPDTGVFARELDRPNVKSFSRDAVLGDLLTIPREHWWTDRLVVRTSDGRERTIGPFAGAKFYKARWMPLSR